LSPSGQLIVETVKLNVFIKWSNSTRAAPFIAISYKKEHSEKFVIMYNT